MNSNTNVNGQITGAQVIAGGFNVKTYLTNHSNQITQLFNDQNRLTADLNCRGYKILNVNSIQLSNSSYISDLDNTMTIFAGVAKDLILRNGQSGAARDMVISFDSVDFGGRTLLNTTGGVSQYGDFPDITVSGSSTTFTTIPCSTIYQGSSFADVSTGNLSFTNAGIYRVTIAFSTKAPQGAEDIDLFIRTLSQTGQPSPSLTGLYNSSLTGNSNTSDGYNSGFNINNENPMVLNENGFYEFSRRIRRKNSTEVRPNRFSLCITGYFSPEQQLRLNMRANNEWTLSFCKYIIERVG